MVGSAMNLKNAWFDSADNFSIALVGTAGNLSNAMHSCQCSEHQQSIVGSAWIGSAENLSNA
jgi:hypothetical protein